MENRKKENLPKIRKDWHERKFRKFFGAKDIRKVKLEEIKEERQPWWDINKGKAENSIRKGKQISEKKIEINK